VSVNDNLWSSHDLYTYEVDEFQHVCGAGCGGSTQLNFTDNAGQLGYVFSDMFADTATRELFVRVLDYVRDSSETISFPFRCDSETHHVYQRCVVFMSSSRRVAFVNRMVGKDPRPSGVRWVRNVSNNSQSADFLCCSICNRLSNQNNGWTEFQQLVEENTWSGEGAAMQCSMTVCPECENGVVQRISETRRPTQLTTTRQREINTHQESAR
jgi:hypothetical protein